MKKYYKQFIKYFLMGLAFSLVSMLLSSCDVKAFSSAYWGTSNDLRSFYRYDLYDVSSNGTWTKIDDTTSWISNEFVYGTWIESGTKKEYANSVDTHFAIRTANKVTLGYGGTGISYQLSVAFTPGYLYATSVYVCSDQPNAFDRWFFQSGEFTGNVSATDVYKYHFRTDISTTPYADMNVTFQSCSVYKYIFSPTVTGSWVSLRQYKAPGSTVSTTGYFYYLGYSFESLGIYKPSFAEEISEMIDNSGFATADSVAEVQDSVNEVKQGVNDLNDSINNSDSSEATSDATDFFNNFENSDYGLSDVITMPLQLINKITSAQCTPLQFTMPFVNYDVTLPCMYSIYEMHFGAILTIYQTITFGLISYWVCINIYAMVRNFKDPDKDEIQVMDL